MTENNLLGSFYLGKRLDPEEKLSYEAKNLATHAVCVGMTGSGKTGLGIALLEEAALDSIPALIIDPKGDLGNLLLAFPELKPEDFLPWIDAGEAERKGTTPEKYAESVANSWKEGLKAWGEDQERIQRYKTAVVRTIYTPASQAGVSLSILNSFTAPSAELLLDTGALRERILSTTSSLLGLVGIDADPIKSKEHILISTIFDYAWRERRDLDLPTLIQQIQKPPFEKVGVFALETFYPAKERLALSMTLNNLLASPGFQAWMEGEPLDIQKMLYTNEGKARHAIISIAHLSDAERMFFMTLFLNELLAWVRRQTGTSSLRALLYMDEIFGFFPPIANPPTKLAMLTLLKQARAFGLGIVLATQNPVDLDYKGLSNCGTWFIGKLQTERDKSKVLEGLQISTTGELGVDKMRKMLASCGNRTFILRSVYLPEPFLFQTRWTLCYLRGPLTLPQIQRLMDQQGRQVSVKSSSDAPVQSKKPALPLGIEEYTLKAKSSRYRPLVVGIGKLHFVDAKNKIDAWQEKVIVAPYEASDVQWAEGEAESKENLSKDIPEIGQFDEIPTGLLQAKNYQIFAKSFANFLYQDSALELFQVDATKMVSRVGESKGEFQARISQTVDQNRDQEMDKIKATYAGKIAAAEEKIRKAQDKLEKQKEQAGQQKFDTLIAFGKTILGAVFGRGKISDTSISRAGSSIRKAGKINQESRDVAAAEDNLAAYQEQLTDLEDSLEKELAQKSAQYDLDKLAISTLAIRPRKTDIQVETIALLWRSI